MQLLLFQAKELMAGCMQCCVTDTVFIYYVKNSYEFMDAVRRAKADHTMIAVYRNMQVVA